MPRYHKPLVFDLMEFVDLWEYLLHQLQAVDAELADRLFMTTTSTHSNPSNASTPSNASGTVYNRDSMSEGNYYRRLVRKEVDGEEYAFEKFNEEIIRKRFRVFLLVKTYKPPPKIMDIFIPIWVLPH